MRAIVVLMLLDACAFHRGVAETDDATIVDPDAHIDTPTGVIASCRDLLGMPSGLHKITPAGTQMDVYCDEQTDGGGWTEIATMVNADGMRHWNSLAAFTTAATFGTLATRDTADYKSPAYAVVPATDLMIVTNQYSFAFHGLLGAVTLPSYLSQNYPAAACSRTWIRAGADFSAGLSSTQANTLGFILRGRDENDFDCFPVGDETNLVAFTAGDWQNNGIGNSPTATSAWGTLDVSLPNLANFATTACTGGYPCITAGEKVNFDGYDGTTKVLRAAVFVR